MVCRTQPKQGDRAMNNDFAKYTINRRQALHAGASLLAGLSCLPASASAAQKQAKPSKVLEKYPPLKPLDMAKPSDGWQSIDLFLLTGQSNMKGRGHLPEQPKDASRIAMLHMRDDRWYAARDPLHLVGDSQTYQGAGNEGVGPGLTFAESLLETNKEAGIGLIPCAVGGTAISLWQKGAKLYEDAVRRAKLATASTTTLQGKVRGVLWLQGEADSKEDRIPLYSERLLKMIDDLRSDLKDDSLPFIACTILEGADRTKPSGKSKINEILLSLPKQRKGTACVDARDLTGHIGDNVHYDTASQEEIGRCFAAKYRELVKEAS